MNIESISWNSDQIAGHDANSNPINVGQLIEALNGYEQLACIASLSSSMRDNLARAAAENYRVKCQNEDQQRTIRALEDQLNSAYSKITSLLQEHADIDNSKALEALAHYANPQNWHNPYDNHGEPNTQQRNVWGKGYHGYELAMSILKDKQQAA